MTEPSIPDPRVRPTMSVDELIEPLGLSRGSVYEGIRSGAIPSIRVGRRWLVPTAAVRRLLQLPDHEPSIEGAA